MEFDPRLIHPFPCIVAGPTGSGKTVFVKTLLSGREQFIDGPPEYILWCYGEFQPMFAELQLQFPSIEFHEGLPKDVKDKLDSRKRNMIVIDDLMTELGDDKRVTHLFSKGSHHRNCSVLFLTQNLFHKGKENRNFSLNAHYIVLFKSPRDSSAVRNLAQQMYPGKHKFVLEAYADATAKPFGYLLIDLKQTTPDQLRLRANIFEPCVDVYVPSI